MAFRLLPYIPSKDELIRIVVSKYKSTEAPAPSIDPGFIKLRRLETRRVRETSRYLIELVRDIVMNMPFVDKLHPFYRDLLDLLIGIDRYRHALGKLAHLPTAIRAIEKDTLFLIRIAGSREEIIKARRMYIGRVIDLIEDIAPELDYLREAVKKMKRLPAISPDLYTIVVAGMPNVGKSSLVRAVSSAKPEIAEYPFTTKEIHVGHIRLYGDAVVQVIDTPGLLDRPLSEMNEIERQAVLALRHLAKVILFLIDPTMHSGYELERQIKLLEEVVQNFGNVPIVVVINKVDIASREEVEAAREAVSRYVREVHEISAIDEGSARRMIMDIVDRYIVPMFIRELRSGSR
ncbi:MAG: GTP-binding protein [Crenarchaeota archaeon]|nr:GTP-binding protein [Thermoproteota archaeon]